MPVSGTYKGEPEDFVEMEVVVEVRSMDTPPPAG
jgi:hypothetical protein